MSRDEPFFPMDSPFHSIWYLLPIEQPSAAPEALFTLHTHFAGGTARQYYHST